MPSRRGTQRPERPEPPYQGSTAVTSTLLKRRRPARSLGGSLTVASPPPPQALSPCGPAQALARPTGQKGVESRSPLPILRRSPQHPPRHRQPASPVVGRPFNPLFPPNPFFPVSDRNRQSLSRGACVCARDGQTTGGRGPNGNGGDRDRAAFVDAGANNGPVPAAPRLTRPRLLRRGLFRRPTPAANRRRRGRRVRPGGSDEPGQGEKKGN